MIQGIEQIECCRGMIETSWIGDEAKHAMRRHEGQNRAFSRVLLNQAYQFLQDVHRVEDYLDQLNKGKEPGKVRIILE